MSLNDSPPTARYEPRVAAAALNPFDNAVLGGYLKDRMEHRFPLVPASDFSGTIDAVGSGVHGFAVGDTVFGVTGKMFLGEGVLAEKTNASTGTIAKRPDSLSDVDAAALALAGVSALMCVDAAALKPKDVVVVVGSVGWIWRLRSPAGEAARGARHRRNPHRQPRLREGTGRGRGGRSDRGQRGRGPQGQAQRRRHSHHRHRQRHSVACDIELGSAQRRDRRFDEGGRGPDELAKHGLKGVNVQTQMNTERLDAVAKLAADGKLKAPRIHKFPLNEANEAFKLLGKTDGKIVVTP